MPLEQVMLANAVVGELTDGGEGPFGLDAMRTWREERTVRAAVLRHLLIEDQWPVDAGGVRLSGVRISGILNLKAVTLRCPLSLDACYFDAGGPACLDYASVTLVALTGCQLSGLTACMITARALDLTRSVFTAPVRLTSADIAGVLNCRGTTLAGRDTDGSSLIAARVSDGGDVFLDHGFTATGAVELRNANIGGLLSCRSANLTGCNLDGQALMAQGIRTGGSIFLDMGFTTAVGAIQLHSAAITGVLNCRGAKLTGCDSAGYSLLADAMTTSGDVILDQGFTAARAVRLPSSEIRGQLNCRGAGHQTMPPAQNSSGSYQSSKPCSRSSRSSVGNWPARKAR